MERRRLFWACAATAIVATCLSSAHAALVLNEVFTNPPGTDNTQEFFEIKSSTGGAEAMTGLHLLVVEGETTSAGVIDQAFDLGSFSTGTNGLFYWRADAAVGSFSPAPEAASTSNTADFVPDLENGTQTYLLVSGFTGAVNDDLDSDNDGILNGSLPWTSLIDAIGVRDGTASGDWAYGTQLGFADFPIAPTGFEAETILRLSHNDRWVASDIAGTNPGGPYTFDALETIFTNGSAAPVTLMDFDDVSPGSTNPSVPEPSTVALAGLALVGTLAGRRVRIVG